jgi:Tfp pilus assembly protein PilX
MLIAMLVMILLSALGITLLTVASTENSIAYNSLWGEGALTAAEAGINRGLNQLNASAENSIQPIPQTTIPAGGQYWFRSGTRGQTDPAGQRLNYLGSQIQAGYSIAVGTGYNPSGYAFHLYQIRATGAGPRNAQRELEVRAQYGPVAQ